MTESKKHTPFEDTPIGEWGFLAYRDHLPLGEFIPRPASNQAVIQFCALSTRLFNQFYESANWPERIRFRELERYFKQSYPQLPIERSLCQKAYLLLLMVARQHLGPSMRARQAAPWPHERPGRQEKLLNC